MLMYMFSISNENILVSILLMSMVFRPVIRCRELYVYGRCRQLHNVFVKCFVNLYVGAFFQLIIGLMGVFGLCNLIVAWRLGGAGFMSVYLPKNIKTRSRGQYEVQWLAGGLEGSILQ
jgi:hypothetical protein